MNLSMKRPIIGLLAAIAITTAMDANGLSVFSALPLLLLTGVFWYWERLSAKEIGLVWGRSRGHGLAVLYPLLVLGTITLIVFLLGAVDLSGADWNKAGLNMALMSSVGVIMVLLTEEGFFRGWLWASLKRAGLNDRQVLVRTSIAFSLWHISAVSLETGFDLPAPQIPVYLVNAVVIGAIWGMLRLISGSVLVTSVSHAVWNGLVLPSLRVWQQDRDARHYGNCHLRTGGRCPWLDCKCGFCGCAVALGKPAPHRNCGKQAKMRSDYSNLKRCRHPLPFAAMSGSDSERWGRLPRLMAPLL